MGKISCNLLPLVVHFKKGTYMKYISFILVLVSIILGFPTNLIANQENSSINVEEEKKANYLLDSFLLTAGILTQYPLTHEVGHWIASRATGNNVEFSELGGGTIKGNPSDQDKNIVASSGFIFPMIISEASLDVPLSKGSPYIMGLIIGPLIHNASYIIQDIFNAKSDKYNDFETMDKAGLGREITYPVSLIIPAIQVWRLISNKDFKSRWGFWMGASEKGGSLAMNYKF